MTLCTTALPIPHGTKEQIIDRITPDEDNTYGHLTRPTDRYRIFQTITTILVRRYNPERVAAETNITPPELQSVKIQGDRYTRYGHFHVADDHSALTHFCPATDRPFGETTKLLKLLNAP